MFEPDRSYKIHWELTDRCNLKCPMCPRTDANNRCRPVQGIGKLQFSLNDVKRRLPGSFLKKVKRIDFCGNFGEPCMARDFYEICEYLIATHGIQVMVSTNGSIRGPQWWEKLGRVFADTDSWLEFHVDGLADTNHLYRIGADWARIMSNAEAFISAGAHTDWVYILFKHNQHQADAACELAGQMGFRNFVATGTSRFSKEGLFRFVHPDGTPGQLEPATLSAKSSIKNTGVAASARIIDTHLRETGPTTTIRCKSSRQNRFYIDASGDVAPCCWIFSRDARRPGDMLRSITAAGRSAQDFNLHRRSIEEILQDPLFRETFPQLWQQNFLSTCSKKCGWQPRMLKRKVEF
jgi:MoaA/NifB/PqqE/SkfB family radical SAM enzyme